MSHKTVILHIRHSMSHAPSLLFPSHLSTTSVSTCTPVRPSTRPSTRPSLMSTSHGYLSCADPSNVSFRPLAETHSPTGYEPKDLREHCDSPLLNRIWMMSKYGICWRHRCTYRREKQVPTDHEFITLAEKTQCQVHLTSEKVHRNLPQCSHTKESRVKRHFPTDKAFPQDINQSQEKAKHSSGSLIRKKLRD